MTERIAEMERIGRVHPSLVASADWERIKIRQRKRALAKLLRQVKTCKKSLTEYADSISNVASKSILANAVMSLDDVVWIVQQEEDKE